MPKHKLADPECELCGGWGFVIGDETDDLCICVKEREAINKAESLED